MKIIANIPEGALTPQTPVSVMLASKDPSNPFSISEVVTLGALGVCIADLQSSGAEAPAFPQDEITAIQRSTRTGAEKLAAIEEVTNTYRQQLASTSSERADVTSIIKVKVAEMILQRFPNVNPAAVQAERFAVSVVPVNGTYQVTVTAQNTWGEPL